MNKKLTPEQLIDQPGAMNEVEIAAYKGKLSDMISFELLDELLGLLNIAWQKEFRERQIIASASHKKTCARNIAQKTKGA
jgi:hypothetical protein